MITEHISVDSVLKKNGSCDGIDNSMGWAIQGLIPCRSKGFVSSQNI